MDPGEELRRLREEIALLDDRLDRLEAAFGTMPRALVVTLDTDGAYPGPGRFFKCKPRRIEGPELEGGEPVFTFEGPAIYAAHIGASAPVISSEVIAVWVPYRWVFQYG